MSVTALYEGGIDSDLGEHRERLHDLAVEVNARQMIELGVRGGVSTVSLVAAAERTGGRVWSCDMAPHTAPYVVAESPLWTFHEGDDVAPEALDSAPAECDLLFIDTSHTGGHTAAELRLYGPRVRDGGVIVMHDADPVPGQDVIGPALAYAQANELTLTYYPGWHGLAVIR